MEGVKTRVLVVDGLIGAGKTNLIKECIVPELQSRGFTTLVVYEPVDIWEANGSLPRFYSDPSRYGYEFQTAAFYDRIQRFIDLYESVASSPPDFVILDRSVFTDRLFMNVLLKDKKIQQHEYDTYMKLWKLCAMRCTPLHPDVFIYLNPTFSEVMKRVISRSREGEVVPTDYQLKLKVEHDAFLSGSKIVDTIDPDLVCIKDKPIFHITTDEDYRTDKTIQKRIVDDILNSLQ